jgi:hypothetical protein
MAIMLPSLHDDFLVSYEVNCETRQIKLYAKRDPRVAAAHHAAKSGALRSIRGTKP